MKNLGGWGFFKNSLMDNAVIKIPSNYKYIKEASSKIIDSLKKLDADESLLFDVRLCVEEALINAIKHGNKMDEKLNVYVDYKINGNKLVITIQDEGNGFDYKNLQDPTKENNLFKDSGRGVFLIHHLMDEVTYNDKGNQIKLIKYLKSGAS